MLIQCNNQKCRQLAEVKLDPTTDEVICMECGNVIKDITKFIKSQLRANKQFYKKSDNSESFVVVCKSCGKKVTPKLENQKFKCPECKKDIIVSKAFENVLREKLKASIPNK